MEICITCIDIMRGPSRSRNLISNLRRHMHSCNVCSPASVALVLTEASIGPRAAKHAGPAARVGLMTLALKAFIPTHENAALN